jgi:CRP-like cAMP-binding protein
MIFDKVLNNIGRHVKLTPEEADEFCSLLTIRQIKKKQFLVHEGQISSYESYVQTGCFRTYIIDRNGNEHNYYFAIEDWWTSDIYSRTFNTPAFCNIIAVEDSEVLQITQNQLNSCMFKVPKIESFFRIIYQRSMAIHQYRLLQQLNMTSEERYREFREKYPEFDRRIPQKHIASYLGLTPEFFSSIRSKVLKEA